MGDIRDRIDPDLAGFIEKQHVFFVATAPLAADGHVNLSPKGMDTLRVLDERRVAYLDLTGSGNETAAHVLENGRIVLMFCAFAGPPKVLRLHGRGRVVPLDSEEGRTLAPRFPPISGARQVIVVEVTRAATSCGYAVPRMSFEAERDTLERWAENKGERLDAYRREKNARSIDGLPGGF
jgi:hypothetical protein